MFVGRGLSGGGVSGQTGTALAQRARELEVPWLLLGNISHAYCGLVVEFPT